MPPHQRASSRLLRWFGNHAEANRLGEVFAAPIDVKFRPGIVTVPDLIFVRRERLGIVGRTAITGAPDLIVEILSPSTRRRDLGVKKALYERFGVPEYWTVDLKRRSVTVCLLRDGRYGCVTHTDGIICPAALPGLRVDVAASFAS